MFIYKTVFTSKVALLVLSLISANAIAVPEICLDEICYVDEIAKLDPTGDLTAVTKDLLAGQHPEDFAYIDENYLTKLKEEYQLPPGKHVLEWQVIDEQGALTQTFKQDLFIGPFVNFTTSSDKISLLGQVNDNEAALLFDFTPSLSTSDAIEPTVVTYQFSGSALTDEFKDAIEEWSEDLDLYFDDSEESGFNADNNTITLPIFSSGLGSANDTVFIDYLSFLYNLIRINYEVVPPPPLSAKATAEDSVVAYSASKADGGYYNFGSLLNWEVGDTLNVEIIDVENGAIGTNNTTTFTIIEENLAPKVKHFYAVGGTLCREGKALRSKTSALSSKAAIQDCGLQGKDIVFNADISQEVEVFLFSYDPNGDELVVSYSFNGDDQGEGEAIEEFGGLYIIADTLRYSDYLTNVINVTANFIDVNDDNNVVAQPELTLFFTDQNNNDNLSNEIDTDGDGINDADEGQTDSDGDGIADYLDSSSDRTSLPIKLGQEPMRTQQGIQLSVGLINALGQGQEVQGAAVDLDDIGDYGDNGAPTADYSFSDSETLVFDPIEFTATGLTNAGDTIAVVIPLTDGKTIPANAEYKKFFADRGWVQFVVDADNEIHSATRINSSCPSYDDVSWLAGLQEGSDCIRLTIEDGGPNDADGQANRTIVDPGGLFAPLNTAPVAIAKAIQSVVKTNTWGKVSGSDSYDNENDTLRFTWRQIAGPRLTILTDDEDLTFITPVVTEKTKIVVELTVNDGSVNSSPVQVTFYVDEDVTADGTTTITTTDNEGGGGSIGLLSLLLITLLSVRKRFTH